MPVAVAIGTGIAIAGAYTAHEAGKDVAKATERGADLQARAAERALEFQKEQYADIRPYLMESMRGYQELLQEPKAYKETPGYMFRLQEGLKALGIPEGARNVSGAQMKAAIRYGQDYATTEYSNALARIAGLGNLAQGVGGVSGQYAGRMGDILMQSSRAQAQGITGAASARASGNIGAYNALAQGAGMALGYGALSTPNTVGGGAGYGAGGQIYY